MSSNTASNTDRVNKENTKPENLNVVNMDTALEKKMDDPPETGACPRDIPRYLTKDLWSDVQTWFRKP
jgi:hypothetical protein